MAILFDILVNAVDNQIYMQSGDSVEQGEAECIRYAHALFIEFKRQLEYQNHTSRNERNLCGRQIAKDWNLGSEAMTITSVVLAKWQP